MKSIVDAAPVPAVDTAEAGTQLSVPYYVRACALGIPAYLIGVHLWTWIFFGPVFLNGAADFRSFYSAGWAVRLGQASRLYDLEFTKQLQNAHVGTNSITLPYIHPPFEALFFEPLAHFSYLHAYLLFLGLNTGFLALTFCLMRSWMRNLCRIYWWLPAALFLSFLPIAAALMQGQDSLFLLLLLTGAALAQDRQRDGLAGLLVGLGLFRFQLTIPLALLFLFWRRWRFLVGFAAMAAILAGISGWMMERALPSYGRQLLGASLMFPSAVNQARYAPTMQVSMMSNVRALLVGATGISGIWLLVLVLVISAALFGLAARTRVQHGQAQLLAIAVAVPISYHLFMHDLSLLLLPICATLDKAIYSEDGKTWREKLPLRLAALAFVTPLLFSYAPAHFWIASISWLAFAVSQCLFLGSAGGRFVKPCFS